ncbi:Hsp70 family protein [Clostridium perfringens]|uniref:Hsp70 family protein n=1 Tax=Clostridium perfringens TaxID=1502 RepID=A0AAW9IC53_CLOPF|nr:Hsp70 family protein [Clostridium perfringens]MBI5982749.1 Hsp70 family protein [Clostridium perfringens]MBI5999342.1 Hsp70 family protein [Clostridium perfringens]MBI6108314.1 Hsp70 family protein [Clostridium perfringens]MDB2060239.1 Hsp70 family protein [Clostridium perfringens]MDB2062101.1 Hsp70 family protein [Clostridium perfringens]
MSSFKVGIDLGTTNIVCCTLNDSRKFETIKLSRHESLSSVLLYKDETIILGDKAKKKSILNSNNYIKSSKTKMGDDEAIWTIENRKFTPVDVATELLKEVNDKCRSFFKTEDKIEAVITVPAYFTSKQKEYTRIAGINAGFDVKYILSEPVAAALAYGFEEEENQKLFIIDLGGGTFDVAILEKKAEVYETLAVEGDANLGGDDFDNIILKLLYKEIRKQFGLDLSSFKKANIDSTTYKNANQKLIEESEKIKISLSDINEVEVNIPNLLTYNNNLINLNTVITRDTFESEANELIYEIDNTIDRCIEECGIDEEDIDKVVLVGGSSNMPLIRNLVRDKFGKEPYSNKDLAKLVAMGAALKSAEVGNIILNDIIAHSLGIEIINEKLSVIIPKGTKYPVEMVEQYTTTVDYQEKIAIRVYEGEDINKVKNNKFFGGFTLDGIEYAKAGVPKISVKFTFDNNQILHVAAKDNNTNSNKEKDIKVIR